MTVFKRVVIFLAAVAVLLFVLSIIWRPAPKPVEREEEIVDTEPAEVKNTGELMEENKVVYVNITNDGPEVGNVIVTKGGVISFYNESDSEVKLRITGSLFTEISVEARGTVVSPVFRLRGDYKLEDLTSSKSAMIKVI